MTRVCDVCAGRNIAYSKDLSIPSIVMFTKGYSDDITINIDELNFFDLEKRDYIKRLLITTFGNRYEFKSSISMYNHNFDLKTIVSGHVYEEMYVTSIP